MKTKITLLMLATALCTGGIRAQSSCPDLNGFVSFKNTGGTSSYQLHQGDEEYAAQTYYYAGPGRITNIRVYGTFPGFFGGVPLRVGVYNVDMSGRPTTAIQTVNDVFWAFNNTAGYISVPLQGGGVTVNSRFAVTVQIYNGWPWGNAFNLRYTGNGDGHGQDLASLAGTSTGNNWTSALTNFSKDGDFYIVPQMVNYNEASFSMPTCVNVGGSVTFVNNTLMTRDSMFNKIGLASYTGGLQFYNWNFGDGSNATSANPVHTYTAAGVYTVSLTSKIDGWNGLCSNTYTTKISVGLNASVASSTNVACNGGTSGIAILSGTGGAPTYMYSSNGDNYQSSPTITGLPAGTTILYIRDNLGCVKTTPVTLTQPAPIVFNSSSTTNASCGNSDGSILVAATGVGAMQYQLNTGSFQSTGLFSSISAGAYTITAKDADNCTNTTLIVVNDLGGPAISSVTGGNASCYGANNGNITVNATGGSGTLLYSINGGQTYVTGNSFTSLTAGTYAVIVKDANSCTDVGSFTINQPNALNVNAVSTPATCYNSYSGQINVTGSMGGTGLHNYSLNGINYQSGTGFTSLPAGNYTVFARDVANCIGITTLAVTQPAPVSAIVTLTAASCNGVATGILTAAGTGGTGNLMYSVNGGINYQPTGTFSELLAGVYTVVVKDANNCVYTTTAMVSQPPAITTTVSTTNSTCGNTNGGLLIAASGGAGNFQYTINGSTFNSTGVFSPLASGTYYVETHDGTGCTKITMATVMDSNGPSILNESHTNVSCNGGNNGSLNITNVTGGSGTLMYSINGLFWQTSPVFSNLAAGSYIVIVKDANGCTGTTNIILTQPNPFVINPVVKNETCNGAGAGSATISAAGGAGVLAYSINGGLFMQSTNVFNNLHAGTYNVVVKDAANCVGYSTIVVTEPPAINISVGILNVKCYGNANGMIVASANGGTGLLQYSINGANYSTSNVFTGLPGNYIYAIYVKDASGCVRTQTALVTQPAPLNVVPTQNNVSCSGGNNGAINLAVNGGVYPYSYYWSNGYNTQGVFNLTANTYTAHVSDYNGCLSTLVFTITQPANPLVVNAALVNASGGDKSDGAIDITVTGGTGPYTYNWSNGANTEDITGLAPGAYLVHVTDANGCISASTFVVGNILGIDSQVLNNGNLVIYPNPARETARIETKGYNMDRIEVINVLGQTVLQAKPGSSATELRLSELGRGNYFVKVYVNQQVITKRLVITD